MNQTNKMKMVKIAAKDKAIFSKIKLSNKS